MATAKPKILFEKSGYYFIGLFVLAFLGFWNSYFSKFFTAQNDHSFYFHFHAVMMIIWVGLLILQPLLIRSKKFQLHRIIGKTTYIIMPLLLISVLLVLNSRMKSVPMNEVSFTGYLSPIRDIFLLTVTFSIGVYYRRNIHIHARAMIITGIIFIEPALFRFLSRMLFKDMGGTGVLMTIIIVLCLIGTLIFIERHQKKARWMFPSLLAIYFVGYIIIIFEIPLTFLDPFVKWFAALPLT